MRELKVNSKTEQTEAGEPLLLEYYITVDELQIGETLICESYGAAVSRENGEGRTEVRNITTSATRIERMVAMLADHSITPETLFDVIVDII